MASAASGQEPKILEGIKLYKQDRFLEAAAFLKGLELGGDTGEAVFLWQAKALVKSRKLSEAQDAVRRGLGHHPESTELEYWLGHVAALAGDTEQAKAQFRKIADKHIGARSELAALEEGRTASTESVPVKDIPEEIPAPSAAAAAPAATAPSTPPPPDVPVSAQAQTAFSLARNAMAADTYDGYCRAIAEYERAKAAEPASSVIAAELAYARLWRAISDREQRRLNLFNMLGTPTRTKRDIQRELSQAHDEAEAACQASPDDPAGHAILSIVLSHTGQDAAAAEEFEAARKASADGRYTLMATFAAGKKIDERLEAASRLVQLEPGNAQFLNWLAWARFVKGKRDDAVPHFQQALQVSATAERAAVNLALLDTGKLGLTRFGLLARLAAQVPHSAIRTRFERLMMLDQLIRISLWWTGVVCYGWHLVSQWKMKRANSYSEASIQRDLSAFWWKSACLSAIAFTIYVVLTAPVTYAATVSPVATITAAPIPVVVLTWGFPFVASMILFWRPYSQAANSGHWFQAMVAYIAVPMALMILVLKPWAVRLLAAIVDSW